MLGTAQEPTSPIRRRHPFGDTRLGVTLIARMAVFAAACGGGEESQPMTDAPATATQSPATQRPASPTTKATPRLTASPTPASAEAPVLDLDDLAAAILNVAPYYTHTSDWDQQATLSEIDTFFGESVFDADILTFYSDTASDTAGNVVIGGEGASLFVSLSFIEPEQIGLVAEFIESMRAGGGREVIDTLVDLPGPTTEQQLQGAAGLGDGGWGVVTETKGDGLSVPLSLLYFSRENVIVTVLAQSDAMLDAVAIGRVVDEEILRTASE